MTRELDIFELGVDCIAGFVASIWRKKEVIASDLKNSSHNKFRFLSFFCDQYVP